MRPRRRPTDVLLGNRALLAEHGVPLPADADARAAEREARGETVAFLATGGTVRAFLSVADVLRDEAPEAVRALRDLGLAVSVVSGDGPGATRAVAAALAVEGLAEATPQQKREVVARRQAAGRRVLFAGDGVNDAPALGQSEVGAAMGRGTDVTLESADVVLVRDDLRLLPDLVRTLALHPRGRAPERLLGLLLQRGRNPARDGGGAPPHRRRRGDGRVVALRGGELAAAAPGPPLTRRPRQEASRRASASR